MLIFVFLTVFGYVSVINAQYDYSPPEAPLHTYSPPQPERSPATPVIVNNVQTLSLRSPHNFYLPPIAQVHYAEVYHEPQNTYLPPPLKPHIPTRPQNVYLPPIPQVQIHQHAAQYSPQKTYLPPVSVANTLQHNLAQPQQEYLPPVSHVTLEPKPQNTYLPPIVVTNKQKLHFGNHNHKIAKPLKIYLPPTVHQTYLPPAPFNHKLHVPSTPQHLEQHHEQLDKVSPHFVLPRQGLEHVAQTYLPPATAQNVYLPPSPPRTAFVHQDTTARFYLPPQADASTGREALFNTNLRS